MTRRKRSSADDVDAAVPLERRLGRREPRPSWAAIYDQSARAAAKVPAKGGK